MGFTQIAIRNEFTTYTGTANFRDRRRQTS